VTIHLRYLYCRSHTGGSLEAELPSDPAGI
jgi:hypothetical protein